MEINNWYSGCLVQAFPWIDGKYIYVNVRRFLPGIGQFLSWMTSQGEPLYISIPTAWLTPYLSVKFRTKHT